MLIFLDIDGVMVPAKSWQRPEILEDGFVAFSSKAVQVLKEVLSQNTNATIMLTTSHKSRFTHSEWKEIFQRRGLIVNQLNSLVENTELLSRKEELLNWFNTNEIQEDFIIIDDDKSLNDLPKFFKDRLILTSSLIGLNASHRDDIQAIVDKQAVVFN
jgi:ATP-dependent helicase/DNAse subunit B